LCYAGSVENVIEKLPGDYIAGFVDGEGCFALKFHRDVKYKRKDSPVYFYWDVEFAILLRQDDYGILEKIKSTLGCGHISIAKRGSARYAVNDIIDLSEKIVPFFETHPLYAKKLNDFILWKEAVGIFRRTQRIGPNRVKGERYFSKTEWDKKDLSRLIEIHNSMKEYKSVREEWKWLDKATELTA